MSRPLPTPGAVARIAVIILGRGDLLEAWAMRSAGLSYREMAVRVGCSESTARRRTAEATRRLRLHYEENRS